MDSPEPSDKSEENNQTQREDEENADDNDFDPSQEDDELDLTTPEPRNPASISPALNDIQETADTASLTQDIQEPDPASPEHNHSSDDGNNSDIQSPNPNGQSPDPTPQSPDPQSPDLDPQSLDLEPLTDQHNESQPSPSKEDEQSQEAGNLNPTDSELCDLDLNDSEDQDRTAVGVLAEETRKTNSNSTKTQEKMSSEQTEKTSENDSDCGSLNSSLVSQRTLENLSENFSDSQRPALPREDGDFEKDSESVGGSSKAEEESHVVVGLEGLENLANENGRCGSPSIVSEATDTLAGSLVVETGSVGGESGTVRSMPQSELSDYDYQNVENGEEGAESEEDDRETENIIGDNVSETGEIDSDGEVGESKSPHQSEQLEDGMNHRAETAEANQDELDSGLTVCQADSQTLRVGTKTGGELDKSGSDGELDKSGSDGELDKSGSDGEVDKSESDGEVVENESGGDIDENESGGGAGNDDFDYDDLDLETVSETEPPRDKTTTMESSDPADSSVLSKDSDNDQQGKRGAEAAKNSRKDSREAVDSLPRASKPHRSPKTNLAEDHVELDYDEEDIVEEKSRHVEMLDDELENGELPDDEEEGEVGEKSDDGELDDEDDCEEGEIREPGNRKPFVKPICRFYLNGKCTWGNNCRFLHPGVNDKGNYRLIERPGFNNTGAGMRGPMGSGNWGHGERGSEMEFVHPISEPQPAESAWERGLRHAKELMKKASHRKETDPGFEEKRLNLTVEEEREFNKENDMKRLGDKDPYLDPHIDDDFYDKPSIGWQQGQYENFEVRWNREPDYSPYRDKDRGFTDRRGPSNFSNQPPAQGPPMHSTDRFNKRRDDRREKWREPGEEVFVPSSGAPRERADVWHDPWRRSKSPKRKLRESPSRSRSRGRRRYRRSYSYSSSYSSSSLSGSSRSRSRSSYSSLTSRSSISRSSFSSRSRTRSEDLTRRRAQPDPATAGIPQGGGPPQVQGVAVGGKPGPFAPGAGPAGDRKQQPPNKTGEPRSAVAIKQRQPRPGPPEKRRPVIGPMPRQPVRDRPLPSMAEGRGRGMRDREDRGRGRGRGMVNENPVPGRPGKKRGASMSSSGSSRSRSRSRSSSSTSRSRSVSSVSSISSSSSSSSSGSADSEHLYRDIAEPDPQDKDRPQAAGQGRGKRKTPAFDKGAGTRPGRPEKDRPHRGGKDRPRDKRARYSSPGTLPPGGRGRAMRPENRRDPSDATGRPQVSSTTTTTKSKDPMKSVGQKSNIKLTLISKPSEKNGMAGKKRPADGNTSAPSPAKKPPVSPTKQAADKGVKAIGRVDKPAPIPSPRMKPPQPVGRLNPPNPVGRPLTSPTKPVAKLSGTTASASSAAAAAAAAAKAAKKSTSSRREELLKQLKAVEDAIARKRSKLP